MDLNQQIEQLLERSRYIRAIGPTTDDFMRWRDAAEELLSPTPSERIIRSWPAIEDAIGPRERPDAEGLQIHGQFGMAPRLIAAEDVLRGLVT